MTASLRSALTVFALFFGLATALPSLADGDTDRGKGNNQTPRITVPVVGSGAIATFTGNLTISRFVADGAGGIVAVGTLTGLVTNTSTGAVTSVFKTVSVPAQIQGASGARAAQAALACDILNLVLGPLHLDLLGLVIDLNQVVLNITAVPGAGNLLGNLLCAVTGLLDNAGGLAALLNQILGIVAAL
ncbi:MAG: hypothetical protein JF611_14175 [Betaproteobacteria bacterium]|nr:hypothetical protein [Betaproteobacteria bacterium]